MSLSTSRFYKVLLILFVFSLAGSACSLFGGEAAPPAPAPTTAVLPTQAADDVGGESRTHTATMTELTGSVQVTSQGTGASALAFIGQQLYVGDNVATGANSRTRIDFSNGTFFRVGQNSQAQITGIETEVDEGFLANLRLAAGEIWIVLTGGELIVDAPSGVASVRGSYMSVDYDPLTGEMTITCLEGECHAWNGAGGVIMYAGQMAVFRSANTPVVRGLMRDSDVQWWLDNNPEASIVLSAVTATVQAYVGIPQFSVEMISGQVTPTPATAAAIPYNPAMCYVGTWSVPAESIQNYMVVALTNAGYGDITPVVTGSGLAVINPDGYSTAQGSYSVSISSGMGAVASPFSLSGSGAASAFVFSSDGRLNITNVTKSLSSELDVLGVVQALDIPALANLLEQMGFTRDIILDQTEFSPLYTCNEQFMSIVFREQQNIALTLVRVQP